MQSEVESSWEEGEAGEPAAKGLTHSLPRRCAGDSLAQLFLDVSVRHIPSLPVGASLMRSAATALSLSFSPFPPESAKTES